MYMSHIRGSCSGGEIFRWLAKKTINYFAFLKKKTLAYPCVPQMGS